MVKNVTKNVLRKRKIRIREETVRTIVGEEITIAVVTIPETTEEMIAMKETIEMTEIVETTAANVYLNVLKKLRVVLMELNRSRKIPAREITTKKKSSETRAVIARVAKKK